MADRTKGGGDKKGVRGMIDLFMNGRNITGSVVKMELSVRDGHGDVITVVVDNPYHVTACIPPRPVNVKYSHDELLAMLEEKEAECDG